MTDVSTITLTPRPLTPLIGRDSELKSLLELLQGSVRLLTITGIGGVGKTRLAHQAALEMEPEFDAGTLLVPLAAIGDAAQIAPEIARRLGRYSSELGMEAVASILGEDSRLLVLDNLEQIPNAGAAILDLLHQLPQLTILATSQTPLSISGEQLFPLQPMAVSETGEDSPAVELFLHRFRAADPLRKLEGEDIRTIAEICQMLDGIPLAIELAAARVAIFTLPELKNRLSNRLEILGSGNTHSTEVRHRTMRNAIAWSYELLDSDQRRLLRYLGVYVGGISEDAITHSIKTLEIIGNPLDIITDLVDRGFLRRVPSEQRSTRYLMLQTLREFALEQLGFEQDETTARLSHARHMLALAHWAEPLLKGNEQKECLDRLDPDSENFQAACEWSADNNPDITLGIMTAIWEFIDLRGVVRSYLALANRTIDRSGNPELSARGWLLIGNMELALNDDLEKVKTALNKARTLAQANGDEWVITRAFNGLGTAAYEVGDLDTAAEYYRMAATSAERTGDLPAQIPPLANLGLIEGKNGYNEASRDLLLKALAVCEQVGHQAYLANIGANLGFTFNRLGDYASSLHYLTMAVGAARELGKPSFLVIALMNLGNAYCALKDLDAAETAFLEAIKACQQSHLRVYEVRSRTAYIQVFIDRGDNIGIATHIIEALSVTTNITTATAMDACAGVMMMLCVEANEREKAAELLGATLEWEQRMKRALDPPVKRAAVEFLATIPEAASHPERIAFNKGSSWSLEELSFNTIKIAREYLFNAGADPKGATAAKPPSQLTPRETEVLARVADGLTNQEIADEMFVSDRTITTHLSNIFGKLEVKNRSSAVAVAQQSGMI